MLHGLDGTVVRIPNATVIAEIIVNLTRQPRRRSRLQVGVAYDTDLEMACETLLQAAGSVAEVVADPAPSVVLTSFGASSIDIDIHYWHASDVPSEYAARHALMLAVHRAFDAAGVSIAFPPLVVWQQPEVASPIYTEPPATPGASTTAGPGPSSAGRPPRSRRR